MVWQMPTTFWQMLTTVWQMLTIVWQMEVMLGQMVVTYSLMVWIGAPMQGQGGQKWVLLGCLGLKRRFLLGFG